MLGSGPAGHRDPVTPGYASPVEWIVRALVVLGFIAIFLRFAPRDEAGRAQLPRVIDDSIGMWALRRLAGRNLGDWTDDLEVVDGSAAMALERRLGSIGGGRPSGQMSSAATRYAASAARFQALGIRPAGSVARQRRPGARPLGRVQIGSGLEAQPAEPFVLERRLAATAAALVLVIVGIVVVLASRAPSGAHLT